MNIRKLLLIISFVNITGNLFAMDFSKALQAPRPHTHEELVNKILSMRVEHPIFVKYNEAVYRLKERDEGGDLNYNFTNFGGRGGVGYKIERPISFLNILNYKREIVSFRAAIHKKSDNDKWIIKKGTFETNYKINYRNISGTGILLTAGIALVRFALMHELFAGITRG